MCEKVVARTLFPHHYTHMDTLVLVALLPFVSNVTNVAIVTACSVLLLFLRTPFYTQLILMRRGDKLSSVRHYPAPLLLCLLLFRFTALMC